MDCSGLMLRKRLAVTKRGHKLMVPDDIRTDVAITELQQFIAAHRYIIQDEESDRPLTFHGLRHTYAVEKYKALITAGKTDLDAHYEVSRLLGHERPDVTDIYLASLVGTGERNQGGKTALCVDVEQPSGTPAYNVGTL